MKNKLADTYFQKGQKFFALIRNPTICTEITYLLLRHNLDIGRNIQYLLTYKKQPIPSWLYAGIVTFSNQVKYLIFLHDKLPSYKL